MKIEFEHLQKTYDKRMVLDIEHGAIKSGKCTAIIGPNGASKSTLLKILAGIEQPDCGSIRYDGSAEFPQSDITLVFQNPYLISTTVENNIAYPMKLRGHENEAIERRIDELLKELNLEAFRKQKSWKLSGGETQKVALARALSFYPKVLFLDEPTANIDPQSTAEIEKMLSSTKDTTIVVVTHNLAQAYRLCDEVIVMSDGHIIDSGKFDDVVKNPRNQTVENFIKGEIIF